MTPKANTESTNYSDNVGKIFSLLYPIEVGCSLLLADRSEDGIVRTSGVEKKREDDEYIIVETRNTIYKFKKGPFF